MFPHESMMRSREHNHDRRLPPGGPLADDALSGGTCGGGGGVFQGDAAILPSESQGRLPG